MAQPNAGCNATHDPALRSWIPAANLTNADYPIQNLPLGIVKRRDTAEPFRGAIAIGDSALDLEALAKSGCLPSDLQRLVELCCAPNLNDFMAAGAPAWSKLRAGVSMLLRTDARDRNTVASCLIPLAELAFDLPAQIGDYTDFYTSIDHATNIGRLFRPEAPLLPNYRWVPIGYHGRSSSVVTSGQDFHRPSGQRMPAGAQQPEFGPCQRLDYELELGLFIGPGNALGQPIGIEQADDHLFGVSLLNDWSARDIQSWEYQPLGPFLGKNFATSLSPWVVSFEALAPFRKPWQRGSLEPAPLPYLSCPQDALDGSLDISLEVWLQTASMQRQGLAPERLSRASFASAYWTPRQLVAHHSVNGCNLKPGDLLGSGTVSGPTPGSEGALIELTEGGAKPLRLKNGEQRTFLEDGDSVILRGYCEAPNAVRIGLGEVRGSVLPALAQ